MFFFFKKPLVRARSLHETKDRQHMVSAVGPMHLAAAARVATNVGNSQ